jgi:hypothetical protein
MNVLKFRLHELMNSLDREHRVPVSVAFKQSDGSFASFAQELSSMSWDFPDLPVQDILDKISYDLV